MAGFPQQYGDQFQGNPSLSAGAPWDATAFSDPQHPQSASSSSGYRRRPPGQPRDHAGVLRDSIMMFPPGNATGNLRSNEGRVDMSPPAENIAVQTQPQDLQYVDMGYYDMANDYPPSLGHRDRIVGDNDRIVQDVPAQAPFTAPAQHVTEIDAFNDEIQHAAAGHAPGPAFIDEVPHQGPVPNGRGTEALRQLAILYLNDPSSQLVMIRMGPGHDGEVTVLITLKLTDL